jgi:hypothetical protein
MAPSSEHWNVAFVSVEVNWNDADAESVGFWGDPVIVAPGPTPQLELAVFPAAPKALVATTVNVCPPVPLMPEYVAGLTHAAACAPSSEHVNHVRDWFEVKLKLTDVAFGAGAGDVMVVVGVLGCGLLSALATVSGWAIVTVDGMVANAARKSFQQ